MSQPLMTAAQGQIITVGMLCAGERVSVVFPIASDSSALIPILASKFAVESFVTNVLPDLQDLCSPDTNFNYVAAEGMSDGGVPWRQDLFAEVGARTGDAGPAVGGLLLAFYEDPADVTPGDRIRVGHNTIPGIVLADFAGGTAAGSLITAAQGTCDLLTAGWAFDPPIGSDRWYRVLAAPARPAAGTTPLKRVAAGLPRSYIGTQRRRGVPH